MSVFDWELDVNLNFNESMWCTNIFFLLTDLKSKSKPVESPRFKDMNTEVDASKKGSDFFNKY